MKKKELFARVRSGQVRVLSGNIQADGQYRGFVRRFRKAKAAKKDREGGQPRVEKADLIDISDGRLIIISFLLKSS